MGNWMIDRHKMPLDGEKHAEICREFVAEMDRQRRAAKNIKKDAVQKKVKSSTPALENKP